MTLARVIWWGTLGLSAAAVAWTATRGSLLFAIFLAIVVALHRMYRVPPPP